MTNYNPDENNGIVRISPADWKKMWELAVLYDLKGAQIVFEMVVQSVGYREGMSEEQMELAVKLKLLSIMINKRKKKEE